MTSDKPISGYPKVLALGHRGLKGLFTDTVYIEEKVDGSQFSFRFDGNEVHFKSKRVAVYREDPGMFRAGVEAVLAAHAECEPLPVGYTFRGEYLRAPKHNTLTYGRVPKQHIVIWDIERPDGSHLNPLSRGRLASAWGFEAVPVYTQDVKSCYPPKARTGFTQAEIDALLDRESFLGGCKIEGFVVKSHTRFDPVYGKILVGKYVSEAFKEKHVAGFKSTKDKQKSGIEALKDRYRSEARWRKAVQRLRDDGTLKGDPTDIGPLMREVAVDMLEEEEHEIKECLFNLFKKEFARASTRGLPEWYKRELATQPQETI